MNIKSLERILSEQTRISAIIINEAIDQMSDKEYNDILIISGTEEEIKVIKSYAVMGIALRESDSCLAGLPYYDWVHIGSSVFKIMNQNKKYNV